MKVYINGRLVDETDASVSVFDHGFLYGDGVFEGIRLYQGCLFRLEEHLERLEYSAKAIMLDLPWSRESLKEAVCTTCRANGLTDGYVRLIATRGKGSLGLSPKGCHDTQLIIIAATIQLYPEAFYTKGLKIITVPTRRVSPAALPPMVKSMNYLNNILAKIEAQHLGYEEALMLNDKGEIAECTGDNVFIIHKKTVITPPVYAGSLRGITRKVVIEIAREQGLIVTEENLTRYDVWVADECFLTGTAAEVVPVVELDGRVIGQGQPGPLTRQFTAAFRQRVASDGQRLDPKS